MHLIGHAKIYAGRSCKSGSITIAVTAPKKVSHTVRIDKRLWGTAGETADG